MIELKDIKKDLRVIIRGQKGIVMSWDKIPKRIMHLLTYSVNIAERAHININTMRHINKDMITYGGFNTETDVDLEYYNKQLNDTRSYENNQSQ